MSQKPSIGRMVIFRSAAPEDVGQLDSTECPAIITRVHSDTLVNLTALRDGQAPKPFMRVAFGIGELRVGDRAWSWPERVQ